MKRLLVGLVIIYLCITAGLHFFHHHLLYQPVPLEKDFEYGFEVERVDVAPSLQLDLAHFDNIDTIKRGAVLYFHGNTDNLNRWSQYATFFTSRGYDVHMVDYRGYGRSDGEPTLDNIYADALEIFDYLNFESPPVLVGRSLGSSVASYLASQRSAKHLILEAPFNSVVDLFQQKSLTTIFPFNVKNNHDNMKNLKSVGIPVSIIHGLEDQLIPITNSDSLLRFIDDLCHRYVIPGADHKNFQDFPEYEKALDEILIGS